MPEQLKPVQSAATKRYERYPHACAAIEAARLFMKDPNESWDELPPDVEKVILAVYEVGGDWLWPDDEGVVLDVEEAGGERRPLMP